MIDCTPSALAAAARCYCFQDDVQRQITLLLLCSWANASAKPTVPVNTVLPVITGTVQIGFTLSGSNGTWTNTPTSYTYRWLSNGTAIVGATANTFTLLTAQIGTVITFEVTASNAVGAGAPATSVATSTVLGASFKVTTTAPTQTLNIAALTTSALMVVDWGDSSQHSYNGANTPSHIYAVAGTYTVQFLSPLLVTVFHISDPNVTLNSADIKSILNVTDFQANSLKAGRFDSTDVSAWRPANFYLQSMPSGYLGTFNSTDVSAWRPTLFQLYSMPTATYTITITAGGFAGWVGATSVNLSADALSQASVNQILADLYVAFATRTVAGGTITLNGAGNAAPSGIFQANCPPTSGKETAFDLLNDPCTINPTKKWSTVTTN